MTTKEDIDTPQVRIFPHSQEEFQSKDLLMSWLLNGLRGRGGEYHLASAHRVKYLPPGSIVLFRYADEIVGEAVVSKKEHKLPKIKKGKSLLGEEGEYAAQVTFAPSSIRLYSPPVDVNTIQPLVDESRIKKDLSGARPYYLLNWDIYGRILKEVVSEGGAFTN
jgi:hypothetical protein